MPQNPWDKFHELMGGKDADQQFEPPAPAPEYNVPQPPATRQEAIQPMKNYGLLTQRERYLFERVLPGVRGGWAGSAMNWVANREHNWRARSASGVGRVSISVVIVVTIPTSPEFIWMSA